MMMYPLVIGGVCIITSVIGTFFVKLGASQSIMGALYKGFIATAVLSAIALWPATEWIIGMQSANGGWGRKNARMGDLFSSLSPSWFAQPMSPTPAHSIG